MKEEEEEGGLFKADAVKEEDPERECAEEGTWFNPFRRLVCSGRWS